MSRFDIFESQDIAGRIAAAKKAMQEIKNKQFIGTDSVLFYQQDTGNAYDWTGTLPTSPQASYVGTKILKVTAIAKKQNVLFADLISELYKDNMTVRHTVVDYINEFVPGGKYFSIFSYKDPVPPSQTNKIVWTVVTTGGDFDGVTKPTNTCFNKFYVVANDEVDITIVQVN
jgi:hypothetical protein